MRLVLLLWGFPIIFFWGWYFLSLYDMHFGMFFLSKAFHDHLFGIYGNILHMDPADVPAALAWLFFVDTLIVVGIALVGKYRRFWWAPLKSFVKHHVLGISEAGEGTRRKHPILPVAGPVHPAE
jgi:hypothetical protein